MSVKTTRILYTLVALVMGVGIVMALSYAGDKGQGPIEKAFDKAGTAISNVEEKIILQPRQQKRSDKLQWLQPYKNNKSLLAKQGDILLGAYDNKTKEGFKSVTSLEDSLHTTFPLIALYVAWGSKTEEQFPATQVNAIKELGSIPVITWEPWLNDFDNEEHTEIRSSDVRDKNGLTDIANGIYDFYINRFADDIKKIKSPVLLRFGHEMNDPYRYPWGPQNNKPEEFVAAWKHVHDVFAKRSVNNVLWIWSPHPAYGYFDYYYPGDSCVDFVGESVLNYGPVAPWAKWWSFKEIFGTHYEELAKYKKPMIITEFGSLAVGGSRSKWFQEALTNLPKNYPYVRGIIFYHNSKDNTTTQQSLDWYIKDDKASTQAIVKAVSSWNTKIMDK